MLPFWPVMIVLFLGVSFFFAAGYSIARDFGIVKLARFKVESMETRRVELKRLRLLMRGTEDGQG